MGFEFVMSYPEIGLTIHWLKMYLGIDNFKINISLHAIIILEDITFVY